MGINVIGAFYSNFFTTYFIKRQDQDTLYKVLNYLAAGTSIIFGYALFHERLVITFQDLYKEVKHFMIKLIFVILSVDIFLYQSNSSSHTSSNILRKSNPTTEHMALK